jgi:hypothetical protein
MDISRNDLYRIILEEYLKEENITEAHPALDLLRKMKGDPAYDPRKDPAAHSYDPTFKGDDETAADEPPPADETYPMEKPLHGKMSQDELVLTIGELVHGKDPEEVSEIFELVFEKLPGVEIGEPEEEEPEGLYTPGAEGRPVAGFQLEELMSLIKEVLGESAYPDFGGPEERYSVFDPEDLSHKADAELVNMMWTDGLEKMIVLDGDGELANRDEVIAALKNV